MMQLSMATFESWTMSSIGADLDAAMSSLGPHCGHCVECARLGCHTPIPPLAFCSLDADQAFESVMSEDAEKAFEVVLRRYSIAMGRSGFPLERDARLMLSPAFASSVAVV